MVSRLAVRSVCGALLAAAALLFVAASPASAHAAFLGADPADGQIFDTPPAAVSLHFSEKVLLESSSVDLIELGQATTLHLHLSSADSGRSVTAPLPALNKGAYVVRFTVVDPADLHRTVGSLAFGVGVAPPVASAGGQLDASWWSVGLTAVGYGAVMVLFGAAALLVAGHEHVRRYRGALLMVVQRAVVLVAVAWVLSFVVEGAAVGWGRASWVRLLVASDPGRRALLGVVLAAGTCWLVRIVRPATAPGVDRLVAAMAAVNVLVGAYGGHSAIGGNQVVGLVLRFVHLGAVSAWLGAMAVAWWCGCGQSDTGGLWRSVARVAGWSLAAAGVSGFVLSSRTVTTVTALLRTQYGFVVLAKVACLGVAAVFGWTAARRIRHGQSPRAVAELAIGLVAVVAAAVLSGSAPAVGPQFESAASATPQFVTGDLADLTVSANLSPARVGANLLQVEVLNTRRPEPGVIRSVRVRLIRQGRVVADHRASSGVGNFQWADDQLPTAGAYRLVIDIERPDAPVPTFERSITVVAAPVRLVATRVSRVSWVPWAMGVAALWLAMVMVAMRLRSRTR